MPKTKVIRKTRRCKSDSDKPAKPYKDFPLFAHATKRWAKKVRGKLVYFGPWRDPDGALNRWLEQRDDLLAGRTPRAPVDGCTIADLCNRFLTHKRSLVDIEEIAARTFADYFRSCALLVEALGKTRLVSDLACDDFEQLRSRLAKTRAPVALGNEIQRLRVVFKYGYDSGLIDRPIRYGPTFKRPSRRVLRKERAKRGVRMFEARHIRRLLRVSPTHLRAMVLLGINCGLGNADCGMLTRQHLDLHSGWLRYPRPKTGVERRCPLWPETIEALKLAINERPISKDSALDKRVFITKYGGSWYKDNDTNPISQEFSKLLRSLDLHRAGLGFYALRHTCETVGGDSRDQVAVDHIMGHASRQDDMASVYRERIEDDRLRIVVGHIYVWLFRKSLRK